MGEIVLERPNYGHADQNSRNDRRTDRINDRFLDLNVPDNPGMDALDSRRQNDRFSSEKDCLPNENDRSDRRSSDQVDRTTAQLERELNVSYASIRFIQKGKLTFLRKSKHFFGEHSHTRVLFSLTKRKKYIALFLYSILNQNKCLVDH